jgi:hypothetical protein
MLNSRLLTARIIPEVLLAEGRDDVTRAYIAAKFIEKDAKFKKYLTKLSDAIYKALPESVRKETDSKGFKKDFTEGLNDFSLRHSPLNNPDQKLRYELGQFVGQHNVDVLFREVIPNLTAPNWSEKISKLVTTCQK